jgi:hypothetical protein
MKDRKYGVEVCVGLGQVFQNKTKKRNKKNERPYVRGRGLKGHWTCV